MINDVLIIGGGASGMAAAIVAARNGVNVTLLEQNSELGKKILATGNGRCNYTNMDMKAEYFYSDDMNFVENFIDEFDTKVILEFFESLGISPRERSGYVYPWSDQALAIREAMQGEMFRLGVKIHWETVVKEIRTLIDNHGGTTKNKQARFEIITNQGVFTARNCVLATGGISGLSSKVEMKGYDLVADTKHTVGALCPALVGLKSNAKFFKRLSGVRTEGKVTIFIDEKEVKSDTGELQLAEYGISGIPVFQLSRLAGMALNEKKATAAVLDFVPHLTEEEFYQSLLKRQALFDKAKVKAFINGLFKEKLGLLLLDESGLTLSTQVCDITEDKLRSFVRVCKNIKIDITGINDFSKAQVTAGGVPLSQVNSNFESKLHPGLFLVGEVLDVDGICGGYNLHYAWGSGMKAGASIGTKVN